METGRGLGYKASMQTPPSTEPLYAALGQVPLLTALRERRSRRFGLGMKMPGGPLAFQSRHEPAPLSEEEQAAMVFAACGITGHALADLCYAPDGGGSIMAGLVAPPIARGGGFQTGLLIVMKDEGTWVIPKAREVARAGSFHLIQIRKGGGVT